MRNLISHEDVDADAIQEEVIVQETLPQDLLRQQLQHDGNRDQEMADSSRHHVIKVQSPDRKNQSFASSIIASFIKS